MAGSVGRLFRPMQENRRPTASSNSEKEHTEFEAGELQKVLPRSDVSMHSLSVDNDKCADHQRGDKPQHKCVTTERFKSALPRSVSDGCGYGGDTHKDREQQESVDHPKSGLRFHC